MERQCCVQACAQQSSQHKCIPAQVHKCRGAVVVGQLPLGSYRGVSDHDENPDMDKMARNYRKSLGNRRRADGEIDSYRREYPPYLGNNAGMAYAKHDDYPDDRRNSGKWGKTMGEFMGKAWIRSMIWQLLGPAGHLPPRILKFLGQPVIYR